VASAVATAAFWVWLMLADSVSARAPGLPRVALLLLFPATAAPMLAGLVLPRRLVVGLTATVAVMAGLLTDLGVLYAAHTFVVGLVGAQLVAPCRQRSCVIRAGAQSGVAAVVTGCGVVALAGLDGDVVAGLTAVAGACAGASAGALVALAFSRLAEWLFGYSTKLRLVELLSYDHPLLRQLMERAPGTFQHSVAVALLGRAAADAIGADTLLVRVGALYHDVGKMEHPLFFTENQRDENPHDGMAPADSARVIVNHVADGVRLLRQHGVGARIEEFAREHQGTGVLTVFLQRAEAVGSPINPDDFRYPGPRPGSRETAILMMADKIEATARSVGAKTTEEFRGVVDRTIDDLHATGQFDDSPLTLRDLTRVRQAFASALGDVHHTRVAYPAASVPAGPVGRV
jgi:putative nucleotidyltransferase with HDIG domain